MQSGRLRRVAGSLHLLVTILLVTSCTHHVYKLYPGPERPSAELAKLRIGVAPHCLGVSGIVGAIEIDGLRVSVSDYESVEIAPGRHEIRWSSHLSGYWWQTRAAGEERSAVAIADLEAGEEYSVHVDFDESGRHAPETRVYLWIQNRRTGAVAGGERKP